ncbi:11736_t:CDS:2, partial [Entrophospora sp. SA101]
RVETACVGNTVNNFELLKHEVHKEAEESKHIGNEHFFKGNFEEAIRYYQKSVDTCPVELGEQRAIYWGNLSACYFKLQNYNDSVEMCTKALEVSPDYTKVLFHYEALNKNSIHHTKLTSQNHKQIQTSIRNLPARIEESKEKEKAEMISKFKNLANSFLGKVNLSTDNFQLDKDENTGNYSIQFVNK